MDPGGLEGVWIERIIGEVIGFHIVTVLYYYTAAIDTHIKRILARLFCLCYYGVLSGDVVW